MRRVLVTAALLLVGAAGGGACGGGSSGAGGTGGSGVSATGGGSGTGTGGEARRDGEPVAPAAGSRRLAVCGQRGRAMATATSFDGYEEFFLTGDSGMGDDLCVVKFELKRVGAAPAGCTACQWTHLLEYGNSPW